MFITDSGSSRKV